MGRPAADPDQPNNTALATKVPPEAASWLTQIAASAGVSKSEVIRRIIQERRRRDTEPPSGG
jgi:hypothetical protein